MTTHDRLRWMRGASVKHFPHQSPIRYTPENSRDTLGMTNQNTETGGQVPRSVCPRALSALGCFARDRREQGNSFKGVFPLFPLFPLFFDSAEWLFERKNRLFC